MFLGRRMNNLNFAPYINSTFVMVLEFWGAGGSTTGGQGEASQRGQGKHHRGPRESITEGPRGSTTRGARGSTTGGQGEVPQGAKGKHTGGQGEAPQGDKGKHHRGPREVPQGGQWEVPQGAKGKHQPSLLLLHCVPVPVTFGVSLTSPPSPPLIVSSLQIGLQLQLGDCSPCSSTVFSVAV